MQEIINKRKTELEDQLKNDIVNKALMQEQIDILDKQIGNIRIVLMEFDGLTQNSDQVV